MSRSKIIDTAGFAVITARIHEFARNGNQFLKNVHGNKAFNTGIALIKVLLSVVLGQNSRRLRKNCISVHWALHDQSNWQIL
jgi:hypothetical protein